MTFNKTLCDLADEYFEQAQVLEGIIAKHRKRPRASPPNPETSREAYGIKSLLNVLYAEHRDVMETANFLKDNYSGEENQ